MLHKSYFYKLVSIICSHPTSERRARMHELVTAELPCETSKVKKDVEEEQKPEKG